MVDVFRISKYEVYIIFCELKSKQSSSSPLPTIDFRAFVDCLREALNKLGYKEQQD